MKLNHTHDGLVPQGTIFMETKTPFTSFDLKEELINSLSGIGFEFASPVQELTIAPALEGKDIFAQAETGSGKTGSFAIPIIEKILRESELYQQQEENGDENETPDVAHVILSPTRELAQQTHKTFEDIGNPLGIRSTCLIGGESIDKQKELLKKHPHVLVATPGRLCDLIKQKFAKLEKCQSVVFDEADRLFDMGFKKEIEFILDKIPTSRQLIMVSATSNMDVLSTAYKFKSDPLELKLNEDSLLVDNIDHKIAMLSRDEKMPLLVKLLRDHEDAYALVFCNTQVQTHLVAEWLGQMNFKAEPISGGLAQNKRTRLMEKFRAKEITVLVCTDVAARGLDVKDINLVINYDMPQEAANYVHRIGRTGRAGKSGQAISFCAHEDCENLEAIYQFIDAKIPKLELSNDDFATDIVKRPYIDSKTLKVVDRNQRDNKNRPKEKRHEKMERSGQGQENRHDNGRNEARRTRDFDAGEPAQAKPRVELLPYVASERPNGDGRDFIYTTSDSSQLEKAAMGYFGILDPELLEIEVLKKGTPRFLLFGPRKNTYRVTLKTIYKRLLLPYLIEIIKLGRLRLFARVSFKNNNIRVTFDGPDEKMLIRNGHELLRSFEQILRTYLSRKVRLPKEVTLEVLGPKNSRQDSRAPARRSGRTDRRPRNNGLNEKELISLVKKMKDKVLETKEPVLLKPLNSSERRIVHQYLSDDEKLITNSKGEGRLKRIEIGFKKEDMLG